MHKQKTAIKIPRTTTTTTTSPAPTPIPLKPYPLPLVHACSTTDPLCHIDPCFLAPCSALWGAGKWGVVEVAGRDLHGAGTGRPPVSGGGPCIGGNWMEWSSNAPVVVIVFGGQRREEEVIGTRVMSGITGGE